MSSTQLTTPQAVRARARPRSARASRALPVVLWTPADRLVTAAVIAVGAALIPIAWMGASDTTDWDTQMAWTALSIAGVVVVCIGVGIWLSRGFSRVRTEARAVRRELAARLARRAGPAGEITTVRSRVTVSGMAHHHDPECMLVAGKQAVAADAATLAPCGICGAP